MNSTIKARIEKIKNREVPEGYKKTKIGIVPEDWKLDNLRNYLLENHILSNDIDKYSIYSSARYGLVPQAEYYNQKSAAQTNLGYKIVPIGYITYRHMSDDDVFHFNINNTGKPVLVSAEYPVFTTNEKLNKYFLITYLNSMARFRYFCRGQKMGGTRTRLYFNVLTTFHLAIPSINEQKKIAEILTTQDRVIELKEKLLAEKQQQKYLMQQYLTGKRRLPNFSGEWTSSKLGNLFKERVELNCSTLRLLAVTNGQGVIPRDELQLKDNSSEDKSKYKKICVGDIGYNTMRMWQGISAFSNYEGIVSPAYTILVHNSKINAQYFAYLFKLPSIIFLFYRYSQGLVDDTRNLKYENLKHIQVSFPKDIEEQNAIVEILSTADKEIELLKKDIEQEKLKKKSLMQLILTGIVRVIND